MTFFNSGGVNIHFHVAGTGKPIVLIHGFSSNYKVNWENTGWIKKFISAGRQVIAIDLRGHGKSDKPDSPSDYHIQYVGLDVIRLMDTLEINSAELFGYSMGAWISAYLTGTYPKRVTAAVLGGIGDKFLSFKERAERMASAITTPFPNAITDPHLRTVRQFAELVGNDIRALAACTRGLYEAPFVRFNGTHPPILIITGALDETAGEVNLLTNRIPGVEIQIVPKCDHMTTLMRPKSKEIVIEFFNRHSSR
jgi:pimeloyl-ACP methyl ester carboxylesterase